ncbi:GNAT family N-acetyltransferase [Pseudomonas sp. OV226]|uniref:GNAT family N-acetyltransferase n=1 Tax=Pseudomonas sp. OV226 TaxID=2135588 RepID=UPI000D6C6EB6|nr:GNAT family N-acetyltransferase [Pseudomonas sp. OV226]PWK45995.1 acetyltransferase (GNAT) family protein [Pseudomonas sp. OV226]
MDVFKPLRDFFQRRAANSLATSLSSLSIRIDHSNDTQRLQFPFPGRGSLLVAERDGVRIGHVDYSLNVLKDRVYINKIEIAPEYLRQGNGLALLWHLWQTHQLPIVPLYEYELSYGFWETARAKFKAAGAEIGPQLGSQAEMDEESERWRHLVPESEADRSIREYWEWVASEHAARRTSDERADDRRRR